MRLENAIKTLIELMNLNCVEIDAGLFIPRVTTLMKLLDNSPVPLRSLSDLFRTYHNVIAREKP